ncbi:hypothetical protein N9571_04575 [Yoonia sp.]|jgi:hypothetical protein|uniref:hypothetical protein n=1 Tax=Yoonia sp. TaxID=2212373 RepID=UPI00236C1589|nr:hypothetical protein [Yoonia sp.]MDB4111811.1 hypothetical protein [Yoonia sp.]
MTQHKHCYGTMFHDSLHFEMNDKMQGKVFAFELDTAGLARSQKSVQTDIAEWDDCVACPEFAHCYKLCMAKLALEAAISHS